MIMGAVIVGITAMAWSISADREHRDKMPEVHSHEDAESARALVQAHS